jgi:dTDP-4-amino-4,6-dideoxygalactose transaminase
VQQPAGVDEMSSFKIVFPVRPASCEIKPLFRHGILLPKIKNSPIKQSRIGQWITFPLSITKMFYLKTNDIEKRTALLDYLKSQNIHAVFHYVPLHTSIAGKKYSSFFGKDIYTTQESEKLIRLPMFYGLKTNAIHRITNEIHNFYHQLA